MSKERLADSFTIGITYYKERGVEELVAEGERTPVRIGRHEGVQALGTNKVGCIVSLGITQTSRVDVLIVGTGTSELCPQAKTVAELVEPSLP
ncbi:hypothetical protein CLV40_110125 [Actinokineospora auranticolor]|uniref:Uncharacterized protein n=1 Tax=Actinokineospora auranticolor TaxID=155976 RepID=A0A2S6GMR0_9PSEU|nr:hypothetical protein CLV40_110125 [Actinokineospora auranticolor]